MPVNLTREGYERLSEELKFLKTVKRREIAHDLDVARQKGDLKENAEYDAAKDAQAHLEARLAGLENTLMNARIIDGEDIDDTKVYVGATVTLQDVATDATISYMLVSKEEANFKEKKISTESPIGTALMGKEVGDEAVITIPAGEKHYKILKIER